MGRLWAFIETAKNIWARYLYVDGPSMGFHKDRENLFCQNKLTLWVLNRGPLVWIYGVTTNDERPMHLSCFLIPLRSFTIILTGKYMSGPGNQTTDS